MLGRRLPQELSSTLRLGPAALLLGWAAGGALAQPPRSLPVIVPPPAAPTLVQQTLPAQPRHAIALDVPPLGDGYLGFSELRTTAALVALSLIDPGGRTLWRRSPQELGRLPAREAKQPEQGDAYFLPPVANPAPGRWQLLVERTAATAGLARILFSYRVSPRFSLALWAEPRSPAAGQLQLLTLRAYDMGDTVATPPGLSIQVLDARGQAVADMAAEARLPTPSGPQPVIEPGVYFAQWQPAQPGAYRLQARWQPRPGQPALLLTQEVIVPAAEAQIRFLGATPEPGPGGCAQALTLSYDLLLTAPPPSASTHVLNAQLTGPLGSKQVSMPVDFDGLHGKARARLPAQTLRALGWPQLRIESTRLMRFTPDLKLLAAGPASDLGGASGHGLPLCP